MRKVIDLLQNGEKVYIRNHAQSTYMSNGVSLEDTINRLQVGNVDLINYYTKQEIDDKEYVSSSQLSQVATSGSYNDLIDTPTIPTQVTESVVSGWGFTKNTGTYSKPSGGIPKNDLSNELQISLEKADTALQSYTEQYKGTITGISANGTSIATSGVANIPAASTSAYGVTKLSSSTSSTSTSLAATASAVKSAYDLANGKQEKLVSGTNIKTINGQSLLGSGNITISGGSNTGSSSAAYGLVEHGTSDTTFTLTPNTFHVWEEISSLTLTLGEETSGVANEYLFQFDSGDQATILTFPESIKWSNGIPVINSNKTYQVSVLNKLATLLEFDYTKLITFTVQTGGYGTMFDSMDPVTLQAEEGMTWIDWVNSEYNNGYFSIEDSYLMYDEWYYIENLNGDIVDIHSVIDQDIYLFANYA